MADLLVCGNAGPTVRDADEAGHCVQRLDELPAVVATLEVLAAQHAVGLTGQRRAAAIEAADIRAALHRRRHDMPPLGYSAEGDAATQQDDLASELRWLTQVCDALAREELRRTQQS